jgi:hypothetical protein
MLHAVTRVELKTWARLTRSKTALPLPQDKRAIALENENADAYTRSCHDEVSLSSVHVRRRECRGI